MKMLSRWPVMLLLISIAIVCYVIGASTSLIAVIALGALFELAFWIGAISPREKKPENKA